jgi:hypothetical protein
MPNYNRQLDIINPELLDRPIRIIGAGGIGSWTTLALTKMGCSNIVVQDFDKVSDVNVASQIYGVEDIGKSKVECLRETIKRMTDIGIGIDRTRWSTTQDIKEEIVIGALDNIDTRRALWEDLKKNSNVDLFIDGRMSGDLIRIFSVPLNNDHTKFEKSLVPREAIDPTPCTGKAVVYNTFMCGSLICNLVKKFCKSEELPPELIIDLTNLTIL